ncbi:superoxide dismutase family protein [Aquimarina sp. ERC-38]|uniref:superoxide dismutase family protein n=1 Tax=Aquimarina sp. ERC-38 TaxID=2949996 RepID=UPI002247B677|nr:superoxide dismutase family protein [Aquimarina sp. ERC-38]UZO80325.1 superoxide dismutase family protein [Aquimarina sp. ERC-38]
MKLRNIYFSIAIGIIFTSCKETVKKENTNETVDEVEETINEVDDVTEVESEAKTIEIQLTPKSESDVTGTVSFTEKDGMVTMSANLTGLAEGTHAIHLHEKADCSSPDGKSSGGHWNPTKQPHGKWGSQEGYHKGDIGNFKADASGAGSITFATNEWCIGCDDDNENILGKAIIVHQGTDDYTSQPSGAAGSRVSCGGVIQ